MPSTVKVRPAEFACTVTCIEGDGVGVGDCACVVGNGASHARTTASVSDVAVADVNKFIVVLFLSG